MRNIFPASLRYCRPISTSDELNLVSVSKLNALRASALNEGFSSPSSNIFQDNMFRLKEDFCLESNSSILQVGCTNGGLALQLAYASLVWKVNYYLFESSRENLSATVKNISRHVALYENIHFINGSTFKLNSSIDTEVDILIYNNINLQSFKIDLINIVSLRCNPKIIVFNNYNKIISVDGISGVAGDVISNFFGNYVRPVPVGTVNSINVDFTDVPCHDIDIDMPEAAVFFTDPSGFSVGR